MIRSQIIGTGHNLPEDVVTNFDLEKMMDTSDEWIRQRTGIARRHIAKPGEGASHMGVPACQRALESAGLTPADVELLLCCTTMGDYLFPNTACMIQNKIGAVNAAALDLNAACSGFVYGLTTADAYIRAGMYKTILLVGAERVSNRLNWTKRDTAVLFGDGAGAVVLQAREGDTGVLSTYLGADGSQGDVLILRAGGSVTPITQEVLGTELCDIDMRGQDLFRRAVATFGIAIQAACERANVAIGDVNLFVLHQANIRIIKSAADRLGLPEEKVFINIDDVANTTAASIPIALDQACAQGRIKKGDLVVVAAFGAGLTWGASVIRW